MFKTKKILSLFLVVLFMSHYASTTFFVHEHEFSWGTVVHSHIHTESHHDTHDGGHNEHCIAFIAQISKTEHTATGRHHLQTPQQPATNKKSFVETAYHIESIYFKTPSLRAPPVV